MAREIRQGDEYGFRQRDDRICLKESRPMISSHQKEVNDIFTELSELCADWSQYSVVTSHDDEFDIVTIMGPEWIKLMDDILTGKDFECEHIIVEDGLVKLVYVRERDVGYHIYTGEVLQ
jgi:hypothetical protein